MNRTALRHAIIPVYLLVCLVLGGASAAGFVANLALQLIAVPLIGWSLWQLSVTGAAPQVRSALLLLGLLVAIAVLQLVPLPPAIWTHLPGRAPVADGYRLLGTTLPWLPLTLTPEATLASLLWLLPAVAIFLSIVVLGAFRPRSIAAVIVAVMLVSVLIGALQVIGGSDSAYFYRITNYGGAVGFFANSNHNATLLLVSIPFLAALQSALLRRQASPRTASAVRLLVGATYTVIFVGLLVNASIAGLGLLIPVALATWLTFGRQRPALRRTFAIVAVAATAAVILLVVIGPLGSNLFGRQTSHVELSRQTSFALTFRAARDHLPFGSGVGSFQSIYHTQEPLSSVTPTYMNHAHNDWLELLLETGIPGMVLAALLLFWGARRALALWRGGDRDPFAQAAVIAAAAILLHSLVDYPLRTAALSAVFAACVALLAGARPHVRRREKLSSAKHLNL